MSNTTDKIVIDTIEAQANILLLTQQMKLLNAEAAKIAKSDIAAGVKGISPEMLKAAGAAQQASAALNAYKGSLDHLPDAVRRLGQGTGAVANGLKSIVTSLAGFAGAATPVLAFAAAAAAVADFGKKSVESAEEFGIANAQFAAQIGSSEEAAAALGAALKGAGSSTDEYATMLLKLTQQVREHEPELQKLGMATRDANGHLLEGEQLMSSAISTMQQYRAGTDENAFALTAFGRGAKDVYEIMRVNSVAQAQYLQDMRDFGVVVGTDATAGSLQFEEALARQKQQWADLEIAFGQKAMPELTALLEWMNSDGKQYLIDFASVLQTVGDGFAALSGVARMAWNSLEVGARETSDVLIGFAKVNNDFWTGSYAAMSKDAHDAFGHMSSDSANFSRNMQKDFDATVAAIKKFDQGVNGASDSMDSNPYASGQKSFHPPQTSEQANKARDDATKLAEIYEQTALKHVEAEQQANGALLELGKISVAQAAQRATELENVRYAAEQSFIQRKEALDAGDAAKLAQDQAQERQLTQEHTDRLTAIANEFAEKQRQIDDKNVADFAKAQQEKVKAVEDANQRAFDAHQINAAQQQTLDLQALAVAKLEVDSAFENLTATWDKENSAYKTELEKRVEFDNWAADQKKAIEAKSAEESAQVWQQADQQITQAEGQLISNIFSKRQTLGQDLLQLSEQIIEKELQDDIKYWTQRALIDIAGAGKIKATEQGGLLQQLAMSAFGGGGGSGISMPAITPGVNGYAGVASAAGQTVEKAAQAANTAAMTANTAGLTAHGAVVTANTGATTLDATATTTGATATNAGTIATNLHAAITGANSAVQSAGIGAWIGNTVATIANTIATSADAATNLIPFAAGTNYVPYDMPALIHQGEMIIPAHIADDVRAGKVSAAMAQHLQSGSGFARDRDYSAGGSGAGGGGSGRPRAGAGGHYHAGDVHIHGFDLRSIVHDSNFQRELVKMARNLHRNNPGGRF